MFSERKVKRLRGHNIADMEKKLYRVEVSMTYYALAESIEQAEAFASDAIDDAGIHGFSESASECTRIGHVYDFDDGELVYHDGLEDIDVKQAFGIATGKDYDGTDND